MGNLCRSRWIEALANDACGSTLEPSESTVWEAVAENGVADLHFQDRDVQPLGCNCCGPCGEASRSLYSPVSRDYDVCSMAGPLMSSGNQVHHSVRRARKTSRSLDARRTRILVLICFQMLQLLAPLLQIDSGLPGSHSIDKIELLLLLCWVHLEQRA